jgi:hypothetical protein
MALTLLPIGLLLLTAAVILTLNWLRPGFGVTWMIAVGSALLAWVGLLALRLRLPVQAVLVDYQPAVLFAWSPAIAVDEVSWAYALSLVTMLLAVLLTAAGRLRSHTNPVAWAGSLGMTALGLFSVFSGNLFTLTLGWAAIDMVELPLLMRTIPSGQGSRAAVLAFSARVSGLMLAWWALAANPAGGDPYDLVALPEGAGLFLLLACGLRLGVLPLHLPYGHEPRIRRGLGTMLRLVPAVSSLVVLARLPAGSVPAGAQALLQALTVMAAVYAAGMWLAAEDEIEGRPYYIITLAALAVYCVIAGQPQASLAWGLALVLPGGMLFLFSSRGRRLAFIPALGLWGLSALPFSPAASGWAGIAGAGIPGLVAMLVVVVLLLLGYARHAFQPGDRMSEMEPWARGGYVLGALLPVALHAALGLTGWQGALTWRWWWAGLAVALLAAGALLAERHFGLLAQGRALTSRRWYAATAGWVVARLGSLMRLNWLYAFAWWLFTLARRLVAALNVVFEGEGGVLWALLLLALLVTLIATGGPA